MSHEQTAKHLMKAISSGKRPRGRPKTRWRNYAEDLAWSRLEIAASCKISECLEIPTRAVALETPKGQVG